MEYLKILSVVWILAQNVGAPLEDGKKVLVLDLKTCLELTLDNSSSLDLLKGQMVVDNIRLSEARRDFFPTINITYAQTNANPENIFKTASSLFERSFGGLEYYRQIYAKLTQDIFTGFQKPANLKAQKYQQNTTKAGFALTTNETILLIKQAFFNALRNQEDIQIHEETLQKAKEGLQIAEKKAELGQAVKIEILGEKSFLRESELNLLKAQQALKASHRALLLLMELSPEEHVLKLKHELNPPTVPLSPKDGLEIAFRERVEPEKIRLEIMRDEQRLRALNSIRYPRISFETTYNASKRTEFFSDNTFRIRSRFEQEKLTFGLVATISPFPDSTLYYKKELELTEGLRTKLDDTLNLSIFDGTSTRATRAEMKLNLKRQRYDLLNQRLKIEDEVAAAFEQYQLMRQTVESAKAALEFSQETHRIEKTRYDLGMNTFKDLFDARVQEISAELAVNQAQYLYTLAISQIERALGVRSLNEVIGN